MTSLRVILCRVLDSNNNSTLVANVRNSNNNNNNDTTKRKSASASLDDDDDDDDGRDGDDASGQKCLSVPISVSKPFLSSLTRAKECVQSSSSRCFNEIINNKRVEETTTKKQTTKVRVCKRDASCVGRCNRMQSNASVDAVH